MCIINESGKMIKEMEDELKCILMDVFIKVISKMEGSVEMGSYVGRWNNVGRNLGKCKTTERKN